MERREDPVGVVCVLPLQVQFELQPIRNFLPEQFRKAYDLAAAFYGQVHGMSQAELDQLANRSTVTLSKRVRSPREV